MVEKSFTLSDPELVHRYWTKRIPPLIYGYAEAGLWAHTRYWDVRSLLTGRAVNELEYPVCMLQELLLTVLQDAGKLRLGGGWC